MLLTFPHIGNVYIFIKVMLDTLNIPYIMPPRSGKKTLELGCKYGPELACLPLKINLGNFLESIELGADTVIITGGCGPCRFGYYGEMHKEILKGINSDIRVITLETTEGIKETFKRFKEVFGTVNILKLYSAFIKAYRVIVEVDELDRLCYKVRPREYVKGSADKLLNNMRDRIEKAHGYKEIRQIVKDTCKKVNDIEQNNEFQPLKIGLVGDIYTLIEPLTNVNIEQVLGAMGVEVDKSLYISKWIKEHLISRYNKKSRAEFDRAAANYLDVPIGGHARESLGNSVMYADNGFDGVIQIYPLTCMPEIVASSIMPSISFNKNLPVLTLVIDEMTGEAGYKTRIEAFSDMLIRRREKSGYGLLSRN
jgi:predicted nucleotide-binding protein (sugar kinase/HSP70/actin superfamily)